VFKGYWKRFILSLLIAFFLLPLSVPIASNAQTSEPYKVVGYFIQWGMYARNYRVKNIVTTNSADKLTHINYAFANVSTDSKCYFETRAGWGDAYADYLVSYTAEQSVDGVADEQGQPVKGHFNQLKKLKKMYPNLKVLISLGGFTWSGRFSDAAMPDKRVAFVKSCIDLFIRGNLPKWAYTSGEPPVAAAQGEAFGIFDGIDIDWEYPASPAYEGDPSRDIPPHVYRPEDTENFVALLAEFRRQLDEVGKEHGKRYELTIAAPAGKEKYEKFALDRIHPYLDFINIMAYDMYGAWAAQGPTNFQAALYSSPDDPDAGKYSADSSVQGYLAAGVPAKKLVLGVPFYGRGWTNVPNANNGLYQSDPKMKPARATYEDGIEDYQVLKKSKAAQFRDPKSGAFWTFDGETFWNYDDEQVIAAKMKYLREKGLGGTMFWSLDGDDGTLIKAITDGLK
jgi:chitinase